jgi:hypothetical protein
MLEKGKSLDDTVEYRQPDLGNIFMKELNSGVS